MGANRIFELVGLPLAWGGCVLAAVQTQRLIGTSSHSICGPWGCGPETGALVAMHLCWLALLGPPLLYLPLRTGLSRLAIGRLAGGLAALGLAGICGMVAWQWLVWLPASGQWAQQYIWQRCAFAVATTIDLPAMQLLGIGILLSIINWAMRRNAPETVPEGPTAGDLDNSSATPC